MALNKDDADALARAQREAALQQLEARRRYDQQLMQDYMALTTTSTGMINIAPINKPKAMPKTRLQKATKNEKFYMNPKHRDAWRSLLQGGFDELCDEEQIPEDTAGIILSYTRNEGRVVDAEGQVISCREHSDYCWRLDDGQMETLLKISLTEKEYQKWREKHAPRLTIDSVIAPAELKTQVRQALAQIDKQSLIFETWGFAQSFEKGTASALLFWGPPGTGKTLMGQAIASELGRKLKIVQSAETQSPMPGETERRIKAFFAEAEKKNEVLLFDECDSLIAPRDEVGMILGAEINALLSALEFFKGVCVFTTNRLGRMDPAFARRLSATIEFPFPDRESRVAIYERLIPAQAPVQVDLWKLAEPEIAGGNIKNVVLNAARRAAFLDKEFIDEECFAHALQQELKAIRAFAAEAAKDHRRPRMIGGGGPDKVMTMGGRPA